MPPSFWNKVLYSKPFLRQLCRLKNTLRRAQRALAPTKRGVLSRDDACDMHEFLALKQCFNAKYI